MVIQSPTKQAKLNFNYLYYIGKIRRVNCSASTYSNLITSSCNAAEIVYANAFEIQIYDLLHLVQCLYDINLIVMKVSYGLFDRDFLKVFECIKITEIFFIYIPKQ